MEVRWHEPDADGIAAFAALARPRLEADPVRHTVALSVLDGIQRGCEPPASLVTVHDGGELLGSALRTEGRPLIVSALPGRCAVAVDAVLAAADPELSGVTGPVGEAAALTAAHVARSGVRAVLDLRLRLFALGELTPPAAVAGSSREAVTADRALLARWRAAFADEATRGWHGVRTPAQVTAGAFARGHRQVLWELAGEPVGLAVAGPTVAGASRIGPVYTPPAHRGRGYASAVTAAAAAAVLADGARHVVLFTDLANPVSNAIYPRIGFRPVSDAVEVAFRR